MTTGRIQTHAFLPYPVTHYTISGFSYSSRTSVPHFYRLSNAARLLQQHAEVCNARLLVVIHVSIVSSMLSDALSTATVALMMENPPEATATPINLKHFQNEDQPAFLHYNGSPFVARLHKAIFKRMLVGISDGRFFLGMFYCIDKQGNILLQDAVEYRSCHRSGTSPIEQRCLGLILIPSYCRTSCHIDCSLEEQMSLLSLENIREKKLSGS